MIQSIFNSLGKGSSNSIGGEGSMRKQLMVLGMSMTLALAGCGGGSFIKDGKMSNKLEQQVDQDRYIEVTGIGAPAKDVETMAQKKQTSRNAAKVAAQFELASIVKGLKITGGITVEKAMETDSRIQTSVDTMIKGLLPVSEEWDDEQGCVVKMRLDKQRMAKDMGVTWDK